MASKNKLTGEKSSHCPAKPAVLDKYESSRYEPWQLLFLPFSEVSPVFCALSRSIRSLAQLQMSHLPNILFLLHKMSHLLPSLQLFLRLQLSPQLQLLLLPLLPAPFVCWPLPEPSFQDILCFVSAIQRGAHLPLPLAHRGFSCSFLSLVNIRFQ